MSWAEVKKINSDLSVPLNVRMANTHDMSVAPISSVLTIGDSIIREVDYANKKPARQYKNELWYADSSPGSSSKNAYFNLGFFDIKTGKETVILSLSYAYASTLINTGELLHVNSDYCYAYMNRRDSVDEDFSKYVFRYNRKNGSKEYFPITDADHAKYVYNSYNSIIECNGSMYLIHKAGGNNDTLNAGIYKITDDFDNSGNFKTELKSYAMNIEWTGMLYTSSIELDGGFLAMLCYGETLYLFDESTCEMKLIADVARDSASPSRNNRISLSPIINNGKILGILFYSDVYIQQNKTLVRKDTGIIYSDIIETNHSYYHFFYAEDKILYCCRYYYYNTTYNSRYKFFKNISIYGNDLTDTDNYYYLTKGVTIYTSQQAIRKVYTKYKDIFNFDKNGTYISTAHETISPNEDLLVEIPETGIYQIDTINGSPRGTFIQKGE